VPSADVVAGESQWADVVLETPGITRAGTVSGATAELAAIQNHYIGSGRWISVDDQRSLRRVVVLGANLASRFFAAADPIGSTLQIAGTPFAIVGVLKVKGSQLIGGADNHDDIAYVPLETAQRLFDSGDVVDAILLNPHRIDETRVLESEAARALRRSHDIAEDDGEALRFRSVPEITEPIRTALVGLQALLGLVGTVMLAMSGIGVANLMVAIVNARRVEFAIRRACGAHRQDILAQVLIETLVVVLSGGLAGAALGVVLAGLFNALPLSESIPSLRVSLSTVLTTFAVLAVVGIVAGILPAQRAARVEPSVGLRVS
jgi:putative ABC transport system permease protein